MEPEVSAAQSDPYIKILVSIGTREQRIRKKNITIVSALGKSLLCVFQLTIQLNMHGLMTVP